MSVAHEDRFTKSTDPNGIGSGTIARSDYLEVLPVGGVTGSTIEFQVSSSATGWYDLANSYIVTKFQYDSSNNNLPFTVADCPTEGLSDAMWSNMDTFLGGVEVSDNSPGLAPYQGFIRKTQRMSQSWAYASANRYPTCSNVVDGAVITNVDQLYSSTTTADAGWGAANCGYALFGGRIPNTSSGIIGQTPSNMSLRNNPGMAYNQVHFTDGSGRNSHTVTTIPESGIWRQDGFLPPQLDLRLVLTKSTNTFTCMTDYNELTPDSNIIFTSCTLMLKRAYPSRDMSLALERQLKLKPDTTRNYDIKSTRVSQTRVSSGATGVDINSILAGDKPSSVSIMFIRTTAVTGSYTESPFSTMDYTNAAAFANRIATIYVTWGGVQYPVRPVTITSTDDYAVAYANYLECCDAKTGTSFTNETSPMLSYSQFLARPIFCFNLRDDGRNPMDESVPIDAGRGSLSVHATFTTSAPTGVSVIVAGVGQSNIEVTSDNRVSRQGF